MLDQEKVKELYLKGHNAVYIASVLNVNVETVRKCIQRKFKNFKSSHMAEKIRRKEVDRVTKYESKKIMSDKTFILKNRSIYKTDSEGNISINKEVAPIVSFDTPKKLVNEYSNNAVNRNIIKSGYRKDNILFNR